MIIFKNAFKLADWINTNIEGEVEREQAMFKAIRRFNMSGKYCVFVSKT